MKLAEKEAPQILFIERCYQLLKYEGRMAIVLPDGVFGNNLLGYIRKYLLKKGRVLAIIDVPIETFMPNTTTKTSVLVFQKLRSQDIPDDYPIYMAIAETCGHDRRGKEIEEDDVSEISRSFREWCETNNIIFKNDKSI